MDFRRILTLAIGLICIVYAYLATVDGQNSGFAGLFGFFGILFAGPIIIEGVLEIFMPEKVVETKKVRKRKGPVIRYDYLNY